MNPDEMKRGYKGISGWIDASSYGTYGIEKFSDDDMLEAVLKEIALMGESKSSAPESNPDSLFEEEEDDDMIKREKPKQESAWKLRERRYRAWAISDGKGKLIESNEFNFLSEFFQHLEEEYDSYDLMDGICVNEKKNLWLFEGDIVHAVGGEYYQGFHEFDVTGVIDCRGTSYCLVDFKNVIYPIDEMNLAETIDVVGHAYDRDTLIRYEAIYALEKGEK